MNLTETCKEKIVLTAHRGAAGGNIPCNTMPAYEIALKHGADMIEIDVNMTADKHLVIFHPKEEPNHLCFSGSIRNYKLEQIRSVLRYCNYDSTQTEWSLCTLDEVLEAFRGRCFINIDKFWDYPVEISEALHRHNCLDQIVIKTSPNQKMFDIIEEYAHDIPYLPILNKVNNGIHELLKTKNINYVGAELVFPDENCEIGRAEFREMLKKDGKLIWGNAILYNYRVPLSAGHTDDASLIEDPAKGWGWLADNGFDIIQTDWPLAASIYLNQTGKRYKK